MLQFVRSARTAGLRESRELTSESRAIRGKSRAERSSSQTPRRAGTARLKGQSRDRKAVRGETGGLTVQALAVFAVAVFVLQRVGAEHKSGWGGEPNDTNRL